MLAGRPLFWYAVVFAATESIAPKSAQAAPWQRSISYDVSFVALSSQARSIREAEIVCAVRVVGAAGSTVEMLAVLE